MGRAATSAARIVRALGTTPSPVPLLTGGCGSGRTSVLLQLRDTTGARECQYIDVERVATTPERFLQSLVEDSPFRGGPHTSPRHVKGTREAFEACLAFLGSACTVEGRPATFLLDEVLDLRTFESFPGLRTVLTDLVTALESSPNRFVLATRFHVRAARLTTAGNGRLVLFDLPPMSVAEVQAALGEGTPDMTARVPDDELARTVHALTDGRPGYVQALLEAMSSMGDVGAADPIGALVALLSDGGVLAARCRFSYELRLHRARGYGALKAILDVLADEEPLTLTGISQRLGRTPGSTKDYLGWLEDVDLVVCDRKRYRIADSLLRLWIRLHARSTPAGEDVVVREVQRYAMIRLASAAIRQDVAPNIEPPLQVAAPSDATLGPEESLEAARTRASGIVEFD